MITEHPLAHMKITSGDMDEMLKLVGSRIEENRKSYCISLNLTKYVLSKKDAKLRKIVNAADLVLADGISIVWFSKRLGYRHVQRITGIEFAEEIIKCSTKQNWKLFFLGARPEAIAKAVECIKTNSNEPRIVGYHHGYFTDDEVDSVIDSINRSGPDILLIGMGLPQKEYFLHDHFGRIDVKFILPVGGAFDVWAGQKRRSPKIIQDLGMEWLYRSFRDRSKAINIAKYGLIFLKDFLFYKL
jgi:N-acetylglucosaminyldiphosphoundecaprenol N-acetyl-beta-D-mannosaminyltransferase